MLDASRVVDVVSGLLDPERRARLDAENRDAQERLRDQHAEKAAQAAAAARARRARTGSRVAVRRPARAARSPAPRSSSPTLAELVRVHRLAVLLPRLGAEGQVPGDPRAAGRARALRRRAARCSTGSSTSGSLARARRLRLLAGARRGRRHRCRSDDGDTRFCFLRQQADYGDVAPEPLPRRLRRARQATTVGAFAVTAGLGADELAARFEAEHDDYHAIMVKALADRLAEAFAE